MLINAIDPKQLITKDMKPIIVLLIVCPILISDCANHTSKEKETDFEDKINNLVLSENKIGQEYFFKVSSKDVLEYKIKYLGSMSSAGKELKFLNSTVITGLYEDSKRASCTVNIYDQHNNIIGFYYVGGTLDAPDSIEGYNLVFNYNNDRCNQKTSISFKDSIPNKIFVACTKDGGDIYSFNRDVN
jgi:hypothetical protein